MCKSKEGPLDQGWWPDGINKPNFPNTVLRPGEVYTQHSVYKFGVK